MIELSKLGGLNFVLTIEKEGQVWKWLAQAAADFAITPKIFLSADWNPIMAHVYKPSLMLLILL